MVSDEFIDASAALADLIEPSPQIAAMWAARYEALRQAKRVTADGDVMTEAEYQRERTELNAALKKYIDRNGPLYVEGIGELFVQDSHETVYDLVAIHRGDPLTFGRLLELGCLRVDSDALKAQLKAKQVGDPGHSMKMLRSRSLQVRGDR